MERRCVMVSGRRPRCVRGGIEERRVPSLDDPSDDITSFFTPSTSSDRSVTIQRETIPATDRRRYVYCEMPRPEVYYSSLLARGPFESENVKKMSYHWIDTTPAVVSYKRSLTMSSVLSYNPQKAITANNNSWTCNRKPQRVNKNMKSDSEIETMTGSKANKKRLKPKLKRKDEMERKCDNSCTMTAPDLFHFFEDILKTTLNKKQAESLNANGFNDNEICDNRTFVKQICHYPEDADDVVDEYPKTNSVINTDNASETSLDTVKMSPTKHETTITWSKPSRCTQYTDPPDIKPQYSNSTTSKESFLTECKLSPLESTENSHEYNFNANNNDAKGSFVKKSSKNPEPITTANNVDTDVIDMNHNNYMKSILSSRPNVVSFLGGGKKRKKKTVPKKTVNAIKRNCNFLKNVGKIIREHKQMLRIARLARKKSYKKVYLHILKKQLKAKQNNKSQFFLSLKNISDFRNRLQHEKYFESTQKTGTLARRTRKCSKKCTLETKRWHKKNRKLLQSGGNNKRD